MFWRFSPLQIKKAGAITFFMFCICAFLGQVAWSFDTKAKAAYAIDLNQRFRAAVKKLRNALAASFYVKTDDALYGVRVYSGGPFKP